MKLSRAEYDVFRDNSCGFCPECDDFTQEGDVEPDAHGRECPVCELFSVVGVEYAAERGMLEIEE